MEMKNYRKLAAMLLLSFVIMYMVMFPNVDSSDHIYVSLTRGYMAVLMVCPMAAMMVAFMPMMYKNKGLNRRIMAIAAVLFFGALTMLRVQAFVSDEQYMKAMIPHHSSAILTSKNAAIADPEVKALSEKIIRSQQQEISQMEAMLERMEND